MKKFFAILFPVLALFSVLTQIDDELSKKSENLLNRIDEQGKSDSFLYLSGIFASDGESPSVVGRSLFDEYRKLDNDESYDVKQYPESKKLSLPTAAEFCKAWEDDCLEYLFSSQINIEKLLSEHHVLVTRSSKFFDFDEYTTLSKPTVHELFPPYQYLAAAERIKILEAISSSRNGDPNGAIDSLLLQFSKIRRSLALQDNLIGKLVFLMKLSEIVDVMSVILGSTEGKTNLIAGLSQQEKSFYVVAAREFGMSYHTFKELDKHPEFFDIGGDFPGWITRIVYKPNMTINAVENTYSKLDPLAQLSPSEFAKKIQASGESSPAMSMLRNFIGRSLAAVASPNYTGYVARFHDFDAKLSLFNHFHSLELQSENMSNPYYGSEVPSGDSGKLCFRGPLLDERYLRCLRVKI